MDPARAPAKKDKPKRSYVVLSVFFLSIIGSAGYVAVKQQYGEKILAFASRLNLVNKKQH